MRQHFVLLFVLVSILVSAPGAAQQCRYEIGQWGYGPTTAVEVRNGLGLVASGAVLQVVDVSLPVMIDVLAELTLPGVIESMAHTDNGLGAVAAGRHGLFLVDLSDPTNPAALSVRLDDSPKPVTAVAASGNLAFALEQPLGIHDDEFRLSIIDISDPADPEIVGSMMELGTVEDMSAADEMVYLALTGAVLLEVDVSTPQQPSFGTFIPDLYGLRTPVRVEVCDDVVYFSAHHSTFEGTSTIHAVSPGSLTELWSDGWGLIYVSDLECDGNSLMIENFYGMTLIDVSESSPTKIGTYQHSSGYGRHVDLEPAAGVTFTADPNDGLRTIEIAEPDETTEIGIADVNGWYPMSHMARVGHFLVGVSPSDGLTVIDVEDPIRPILVSSNSTLGLGGWVAGLNHHVFVAAGDQGVEVIDISQPAVPILVGTIETTGDAVGLVVSGSHLFVSSDSLEIFDISDPIQPNPVANLDATGTPQLDGNRLLLGAVDGLRIIDVSDPSAPLLLGWLETDWRSPNSQVITITSTADRAYLSTFVGNPWNNGLHVVDIADPVSPSLLASIDADFPIVGLAVKDDILLAGVAYQGRILSFDVSNPNLPRQIAALDLYTIVDNHPYPPAVRMDIHGFLESGPIAYAGLMEFGYPRENPAMRVIDISNPAQPRLAGTIPGLPETTGVALGDGIAVTTEPWKGIRVFDLADPRAPRDQATFPVPRIEDIVISGDVAYLAAGGDGLQLIDLADPTAPQLIETVETITWALDVQDDLLYTSVNRGDYPNEQDSLLIYGLEESGSPLELGSCDLNYRFGMVAVDGGIVVGAANISTTSTPVTRISIIDVSAPAAPEIIGTTTLHGSPTAVDVAGHYVYLTTSHWEDPDQHGLHIMDISDPAHPVDIATVRTKGDAIEVALADNLAYVSDTIDGVLVYDITNPAAPVEVRRFAPPGDARAIAAGDQPSLVAVIADGAGGLTTINRMGCLASDPDTVQSVND